MTPPSSQFRVLALSGDGLLGLRDCRRRLESDPEDNLLAVADPSLNAPRAIGYSAGAALTHDKGIIVLPTSQFGPLEARANFKSLGCGQAEHGLGQVSLQLIKNRPAQTSGAPTDDAREQAADSSNLEH